MRRLSRLCQGSTPSVRKGVRDDARAPDENPSPAGQAVIREVDERWHDLKKRPANGGSRQALDRETGQWLDWECGPRDQRPCKKLSTRVTQGKGQIYGPDAYQVDRAIIPERRLVMSQRETRGIERNHTPTGHGVAHLKRPSIVVSKSLEMVDLTMALFAKFHVNADDHLWLNALHTRHPQKHSAILVKRCPSSNKQFTARDKGLFGSSSVP